MTRIEDLCHTQVPHEWLHHLDACAGSVLTPHDYITNEKRLGNRLWVGGVQCRCCGSLEHAETCSWTAEATRGHHACGHAVLGGLKFANPGVATEPQGLTETPSRLADSFTTAAVSGRSAALDVCVASSIAAAARGDAAFDRELSYYRYEIVELRQQGIHYRPRNSNASVRSRHCLQSERAAVVGEITSAQV